MYSNLGLSFRWTLPLTYQLVQVILDYGCPRMFSGIVLTNSNDGGGGTRSTGDFTVYGSNDFVNMTILVTGTLPDPGATTVSRVFFSPIDYLSWGP